jgi:hypothetical protein
VRNGFRDIAAKGLATTRHDHELVKAIVDLGGRLVDGAHDNDALFLGDTHNLLHNVTRSRGIQTGRGFIWHKKKNKQV